MKDPLYIFVHLHKTGGTTLNKHIEKNFQKDEVLFLYYDKLGIDPFTTQTPDYKKLARDAILKLSKKKRSKIKVISGHFLPKNISKYFPYKTIRYITIIRDPYCRARSFYNYFRTLYEKEDSKGKNKKLYKSFLKIGKKVPNFTSWIRKKYGNNKSGIVIRPMDVYFSSLGYKLSDFYFIGITKNLKNDLVYLFHLLGIKKYFFDQNKSKNFIKDDKVRDYFEKKYKKSFDIYQKALKQNSGYRIQNIAKTKTIIKLLTPFTQIIFDFRQSLGMLSSWMRSKSSIYNFLIDNIKGGGYSKLAITNTFWSAGLRITLRSLTFVKLAILARILLPSDFGVVAIASLVLAFLEILTETGINIFLIQEKGRLKNYLDTAFVVSIARGVIISLLIFIFAKPISIFFNSPSSSSLIILIGVVSLIRGFINPAVVKFRKKLQFKKEYLLQSVIFLIDTTVSVVIAYITRSAVGLIWGMIAGALTEVVLTHLFIKPRPRFRFETDKLKKVLGRGKWLTAAGIFNYLFETVDDMAVGRVMADSSLGIYQVAYKISSLPITEVSTVINRVTLPVYVKIRNDLKRLKKAYFKSFAVIMALTVPIGIVLFFWPETIIKILLGENWTAATQIVQIMAFFGVIRAITLSTYPVFLAIKRQDLVTKVTLVNIIFLSLGLIFLISPLGLVGAGISAIIGSAAGVPVSLYYLSKVLK